MTEKIPPFFPRDPSPATPPVNHPLCACIIMLPSWHGSHVLNGSSSSPLKFSFLPFAVLSLSSFILRCQREQDHHSVGDRPQVQRAEGLAPRSVCSRPQCPVDGVCLCVCACQRHNCLCMCALCQFDLCRWVYMNLALREGGADGNKRKH